MSRYKFAGVIFATALLLGAGQAWAEQVKVQVNGMVCAFCAQGIKSKLMEQEGMESVEVDLETKVVTMSLGAGAKLSDEDIRKVIADSGYDTVSIDRSPALSNGGEN